VRGQINEPANEVFVSAATVWELAIKRALNKLRLPGDLPREIITSGFTALAVSMDHALAAGALPAHHNDPFDRMLIAQARLETLTLVTHDARFAAYDVPLLRA
jgi:PIN domain nuclease of toxin-antitoxin system